MTSMLIQRYEVYLSVTLQAAVHLGKDYTENLRSTKNQPLKSVKQLFQTTERLIKDQTEITGLTTIDWKQLMWREKTLSCDGAVQTANSQTFVFADLVLCLGSSVTNQSKTHHLKDLDRIDGKPMEFEWKYFQGFITAGKILHCRLHHYPRGQRFRGSRQIPPPRRRVRLPPARE